MNKDEGFHLTSNWSFVLTGSFFCVNVYVLCKMYVKHRYSLEPTHIFEMSTVFDIVLWSATFILTNFEKYFENLAPFCIILNFVDSNTRKVLTNKSVKTNQISNNLFDKIYQHRHRIRKTGTNVILICFVIQRFYLGGQFMQAFVLDRSTRDQAKPQIMLSSKDCKYLISRPPFPFVLL